ncbi:hypothetical protein B0H13DRAFT_2264413 [Mycena leptocephala]|nr:hypothetical protein B0H13DRAFT_2264413 [Mycena leptocephala]
MNLVTAAGRDFGERKKRSFPGLGNARKPDRLDQGPGQPIFGLKSVVRTYSVTLTPAIKNYDYVATNSPLPLPHLHLRRPPLASYGAGAFRGARTLASNKIDEFIFSSKNLALDWLSTKCTPLAGFPRQTPIKFLLLFAAYIPYLVAAKESAQLVTRQAVDELLAYVNFGSGSSSRPSPHGLSSGSLPYATISDSIPSNKSMRSQPMHPGTLSCTSRRAGLKLPIHPDTRITLASLSCASWPRALSSGTVITALKGSMAGLTDEEYTRLRCTDLRNADIRRDFSIVHSSHRDKNYLLLGPTRFVNHDCANNCELFPQGKDIISLRVLRPIAIGEEVTVHYGDGYSNDCQLAGKIAIACAAPAKIIGEVDMRLVVLTASHRHLGSHNPIFRVASIDADNSVLFQNSSYGGEIKLPAPIKWSLDDQAAFLIASQKFRDILPGPGFTLPVGSDVLLAFKRIAAQMPRATTAQVLEFYYWRQNPDTFGDAHAIYDLGFPPPTFSGGEPTPISKRKRRDEAAVTCPGRAVEGIDPVGLRKRRREYV